MICSSEEVDEIPECINTLPDELILNVFKFLPLDDLLRCENVCRRWRKLSRDATLWRKIVIVYTRKGHTEVSDKNLKILMSHCDYIQCVKLEYVYFCNYPVVMPVIKKCCNLTSIELVKCQVSTDFPEFIKQWPNIRKLSLEKSMLPHTDNDILINFDHFKDLTYLALADFGLSSTNCRLLISCIHLSHIFIERIVRLHVDDVRELIISKQNILISFHVYGGSAIDDKCLQLLSQCQSLKDLAIIRCESLTDMGLLSLASLCRVEHLKIRNNANFSEMALLSTLGSPNLIKLKSLSLFMIKNVSPAVVDLISEYYKGLKVSFTPLVLNAS